MSNSGVAGRVDGARNPSWRRRGIRILFWCEFDCPNAALCIVQHKGDTFMFWEDTDQEIEHKL